MKTKEYKGKTYQFLETVRLKHVKAMAKLGAEDSNPLTNDELMNYMIDTMVIVPVFDDKDEIPLDELIFILKEIEALQSPLMEMMDETQKKLQK